MGLFLGKAVLPLLLAAVPGMIYTAVLAYPLTKVLSKVKLPKGAKKIRCCIALECERQKAALMNVADNIYREQNGYFAKNI